MKTILVAISCFAGTLQAQPKSPDSPKSEELTVTIGGQVRAPGPRKFTKGMTLYQALQAGGGVTEFGAVRRLSLTRDGKTQTIDLTKDENKILPAQPNDTLEVPQKNIIGR
jgi:protein involved in polysaccharide export with SLBB domain